MSFLYFIFGLVFGLLQFTLTKKTVENVTKGNKIFLLYILLKLLCYAGAVALVMTVLRDYLIPVGIGLAAGMASGAVTNMVFTLKKDNSNNKGDDTA